MDVLIPSTVFFLIGFGILYFKGWSDYRKAKKSLRWHRVEGTILSSKVVRDSGGEWSGRVKRSKFTTYSAKINYSYMVDRKQFQSAQICVGGMGGTSNPKNAYKYVKKYPEGKGVIVYYSPQDESYAVLEPGVHRSHYMLLGFGILFASIGLLIFLSAFN